MIRTRNTAVALTLALALGACDEAPTAPDASAPQLQQNHDGTGLVLDALTGISLPLIGEIGTVTIDQAIITELAVVQDILGNIVGVSAEGVLQLSGGVLGSDVITEDFTGVALVLSSSGAGQCDVLTLDLGPVAIDALGTTVFVDVPVASVNPRANGTLGNLLCSLGSLLDPPLDLVASAVRNLVNAINAILI